MSIFQLKKQKEYTACLYILLLKITQMCPLLFQIYASITLASFMLLYVVKVNRGPKELKLKISKVHMSVSIPTRPVHQETACMEPIFQGEN